MTTIEAPSPSKEAQPDVDPRLHIIARDIITRFRLEHGIPPFDETPTPIMVSIDWGGRNNNRTAKFIRDAKGQETLTMKVEKDSLPTSWATVKAHPIRDLDEKFELSHVLHGVRVVKNGFPSTEDVETRGIDEAEKLIGEMVSVFTPTKRR